MKLDHADWPIFGWVDDVRSTLAAARAEHRSVVLGTLIGVSGPAPRPVGTQMVFKGDEAVGYLSGGCLEADVANHAAEVASSSEPRRLVYGAGSPWIDIRLLCGGSIEVFLERIDPRDPAVAALLDLASGRSPAHWSSDGRVRQALAANALPRSASVDAIYTLVFDPPWRVIVVGGDPIALAIVALAANSGFQVVIVRPHGPESPAPLPGVAYWRGSVRAALEHWPPDSWTAVISATHDDDIDDEAIALALDAPTAYVGVLGSLRRVEARRDRLEAAGSSPLRVAELHAPIGAVRCGKSPWEVAVSVVAEVMQIRASQPIARMHPRRLPKRGGRDLG